MGQVILLGKYSLFGYIIQIAILQVLYRVSRYADLGPATAVAVLLGTIALTVLSVTGVDQARRKAPRLDNLYRAVFS